MTRGPANPITAPGSARIASPSIAYEALTPPVVGFVSSETYGMRRSASCDRTAEVFAICMRERTPSCMRAPPEAEVTISGHFFSRER